MAQSDLKTTQIKFALPTTLVEELQVEASKARLRISSYVVTLLMSHHSRQPTPITPAKPETFRERQHREREQEDEARRGRTRARYTELLTVGTTNGNGDRQATGPLMPDQIRAMWSRLTSMVARNDNEAILREVLEELNIKEQPRTREQQLMIATDEELIRSSNKETKKELEGWDD